MASWTSSTTKSGPSQYSSEDMKTRIKRPLERASGDKIMNAQPKRIKKATTATGPAKKLLAPTEWEVTGRYSLVCTSRFQPVDASEYTLDLNFTEDGAAASLFALFHFPNLDNLHGVMRLCPDNVLSTAQEINHVPRVFLPEFEAACELSTDMRPGKDRKAWLMRWCGREHGTKVPLGGETRAQAQFFFRLVEGQMCITFSMVRRGKHLLFEGTRVDKAAKACTYYAAAAAERDASVIISPKQVMEREWTRLSDPKAELGELSDSDEDQPRVGVPHHNHWENPRSGGVIRAKNKPGLVPGFHNSRNSAYGSFHYSCPGCVTLTEGALDFDFIL